uniref:Uncharacterized protein n=1 Tax=Opuntia streptacantha TaxID=393608 RepID=A0A7C9A429_OPUST
MMPFSDLHLTYVRFSLVGCTFEAYFPSIQYVSTRPLPSSSNQATYAKLFTIPLPKPMARYPLFFSPRAATDIEFSDNVQKKLTCWSSKTTLLLYMSDKPPSTT